MSKYPISISSVFRGASCVMPWCRTAPAFWHRGMFLSVALGNRAACPIVCECRNFSAVGRKLPAKLHLNPDNDVLAVIPTTGWEPLGWITGTFRPIGSGTDRNQRARILKVVGKAFPSGVIPGVGTAVPRFFEGHKMVNIKRGRVCCAHAVKGGIPLSPGDRTPTSRGHGRHRGR